MIVKWRVLFKDRNSYLLSGCITCPRSMKHELWGCQFKEPIFQKITCPRWFTVLKQDAASEYCHTLNRSNFQFKIYQMNMLYGHMHVLASATNTIISLLLSSRTSFQMHSSCLLEASGLKNHCTTNIVSRYLQSKQHHCRNIKLNYF